MALSIAACANCPYLPKCLIAARYNDVDVKHEVVERGKQGYELGHPLKKCPVLKVGDGVVFESNAIARYLARANGDAAKLYGADFFEGGLVDAWVDFAAKDIDGPLAAWLGPIKADKPADPDVTKKAIADARKVLQTLDTHLASRTFLVRERVTLADIVVALSLLPGYQLVFDAGFRKAFKHANRWFMTCVNQPHFRAVIGDVELCVKKAVAPAPEKKKEAPKEQPKKETPKKAAEEEPEAPKPAKKKPFSDLPPSPFNMNDFKVQYSNEDFRTVALPYFYENFDKDGWTLWFADYKYNEDLEKLFMVSNLLGGFCQRVEGIRDFVVGSFLIFGEENNYEIHGAILLRGTEWPADIMGEIPDTDSYNFRKVDLNNPEDKEWFEDIWGWDGKLKGKNFTGSGKVMK